MNHRKLIVVAAAAALAGCVYTPQMLAQVDDFNVCRLSTSSLQANAAGAEITRRGLDCAPHYRAMEEEGRRTREAFFRGAPGGVSCISTRSGSTVYTSC